MQRDNRAQQMHPELQLTVQPFAPRAADGQVARNSLRSQGKGTGKRIFALNWLKLEGFDPSEVVET